MKILDKAKEVRPVDNWRYFYRKWSFWLISMIPLISAAQLFIPDIEDLFEPQTYTVIKGLLAVTGFVASQIKQKAIAVPPNPPIPIELQDDPK